jgi:hypothetical protein
VKTWLSPTCKLVEEGKSLASRNCGELKGEPATAFGTTLGRYRAIKELNSKTAITKAEATILLPFVGNTLDNFEMFNMLFYTQEKSFSVPLTALVVEYDCESRDKKRNYYANEDVN